MATVKTLGITLKTLDSVCENCQKGKVHQKNTKKETLVKTMKKGE